MSHLLFSILQVGICKFVALLTLLFYQSVELLLATIESSEEVVLILLPPLMKLGLASLLINLLDFEMRQLLSERVPERCVDTPSAVKELTK